MSEAGHGLSVNLKNERSKTNNSSRGQRTISLVFQPPSQLLLHQARQCRSQMVTTTVECFRQIPPVTPLRNVPDWAAVVLSSEAVSRSGSAAAARRRRGGFANARGTSQASVAVTPTAQPTDTQWRQSRHFRACALIHVTIRLLRSGDDALVSFCLYFRASCNLNSFSRLLCNHFAPD